MSFLFPSRYVLYAQKPAEDTSPTTTTTAAATN